jgi:hypothetical protein
MISWIAGLEINFDCRTTKELMNVLRNSGYETSDDCIRTHKESADCGYRRYVGCRDKCCKGIPVSSCGCNFSGNTFSFDKKIKTINSGFLYRVQLQLPSTERSRKLKSEVVAIAAML